MSLPKYTRSVAISVVIANMIGTGVFTSLGFQVLGLPDAFTIMLLWLVGGIIALCGAFCYAEIATRLKESGGEYLYLSRVFHPVFGFTSAWISLFAGFAGAIAASALALGEYSGPLFGYEVIPEDTSFFTPQKLVALSALVILSLVHIRGVKIGGIVQNVLTGIKITLIAFFCLSPFFISSSFQGVDSFAPAESSMDYIFSMGFAGSLAFVMFAYSGWNAASYIAENVENPRKTLPSSLILGTLIVTIIYLSLNAMFLATTPMDSLAGNADIGNVVALRLFGMDYGTVFSGLFSLALLSTCSSMVIAGPRVLEKVGQDHSFFKSLTKHSRGGTPIIAIVVQSTISAVLIMYSNFQEMIEYISIILMVFASAAIVGLFVLRYRDTKRTVSDEEKKSIFRTPLFPLPAIIFLAAASWMVFYFVTDPENPDRWWKSLISLLPGPILYYITTQTNKK
ncbi:MAG: APC family permease [Flavobacteriales bacterium]